MLDLKTMAVLVGGVLGSLGLAMALMPAGAGACLRAFPRNLPAGWLLAVVDIVWVTLLVLDMGNEWVNTHRLLIGAIAVLLAVGVFFFMEELLAARAFGGLLLLMAQSVLDSAFVHPAHARLVLTFLAYGFVVCGIVLVWSPYWFRKSMNFCATSLPSCRWTGCALLLAGLCVASLGWWVY